jgi:hypothetical protein
VLSVDRGRSRAFLRFDSFGDFECWYTKLSPCMRTISEAVTTDMRKLVLDIDSPKGPALDRLLMYDFEKHVTSRIHEVFFSMDIEVPEVVMYSMCSAEKLSYHAVVSNFLFSAQTCLGLCSIISLGQAWECCVDMGVYKSVQFIRIEGSTKYGEHRWKERLAGPGPLRQGIISDPVGARASGLRAVTWSSAGGQIASAATWSKELRSYIRSQFRAGTPTHNGIVPLYRARPGLCIQCNRVHNRDNAFIRYSPLPVFVCWRYYARARMHLNAEA